MFLWNKTAFKILIIKIIKIVYFQSSLKLTSPQMPPSHVCDCRNNLRLEIVLKYLV